MLRRVDVLRITAVAAAMLGGAAPAAHANVVDTVTVASLPSGPQIVVAGSPGDDFIGLNGNGMLADGNYGPNGQITIDATDRNIDFTIDPSAQSRCVHPPAPPHDGSPDPTLWTVQCSTAGLLAETPTRKPLRVEVGGGNNGVSAVNAPFGVELVGGPSGDSLTGSDHDDLIDGAGGNDNLNGWYGDDVVSGGDGNDTIFGGYGDDVVNGDDGDDWVVGNQGSDELSGGPGDDEVEMTPFKTDIDDTEEVADRPSTCGPGDDTVIRDTPATDPITSDASCETDVRLPENSPPRLHGTLAQGSTLTATRTVVGAPPTKRLYLWYTCDGSGQFRGDDCEQRSTCQTFRLDAEDVGRLVVLRTREVFYGSGGRFESQPRDEVVTTSGTVAAARAAGAIPGPVVATDPASQSAYTATEWHVGDEDAGSATLPLHANDRTGAPLYAVGVPSSNVQTDCSSLNVDGTPAAPSTTPVPTTPTPTTPVPTTPTPTTPVPTTPKATTPVATTPKPTTPPATPVATTPVPTTPPPTTSKPTTPVASTPRPTTPVPTTPAEASTPNAATTVATTAAPAVTPPGTAASALASPAAPGSSTTPITTTQSTRTAELAAIADQQTSALAKALAKSLVRFDRADLAKGGKLKIAVRSGKLAIRVQVHPAGGSHTWVTAVHGSGAAGATSLTLRGGRIGKARLAAARPGRGKLAVRVVVVLIDAGVASTSTRSFHVTG